MGTQELIVVAVIAVLVIFGAKKIPEWARSIGKAQGEFKKGVKEGAIEDDEAAPQATPTTPAPQVTPTTPPPASPPAPQAPAAQPAPEVAAPGSTDPTHQPPAQA